MERNGSSQDYLERVYAGVLGKIIGVYLGRPIEGWTYERITERFGQIDDYVHEELGVPLVVTDDDITGTFTFVRALADHHAGHDLTAAQIGRTWLNYLIEGRTILWWGGNGNSTEHTAYLRLKSGIPAPDSGSARLNGRLVAEQIGAQIFIEGWGMVAPGDPELAAMLAGRAASVSHDGAAVHGAQVVAALVAGAFVEPDLDALLDTAVALVPADGVIHRLVADVREWHATEPDWRVARERIARRYGYDRYGGNCHIVPNHALVLLALLYGDDDFGRSLMIVNTSGWDTDCNSANVGCILGIKNGLAGLSGEVDFRSPVADRLYLPTADGGRAISDAATEAIELANVGRRMAGEGPIVPKGGARFHFELPGSVQGFQPDEDSASHGTLALENVAGPSEAGTRALALRYRGLVDGRLARALTPTFTPSLTLAETFERRGYELLASPTLHPGQTIRAALFADPEDSRPLTARIVVRAYGRGDALAVHEGPSTPLPPGRRARLDWRVPDMQGAPIAFVGVQLEGRDGASGTVYLDFLTWDGEVEVTLGRPPFPGMMWRRAWVNGLDHPGTFGATDPWPEPYRIIQNDGRGLLMHGGRSWRDYRVAARLTPYLCGAGGLAVRVQGMRRYYALLLDRESARLVRVVDEETCLAEAPFAWAFGAGHDLELQVASGRLVGSVDGRVLLEAPLPDDALAGGGVALVCEEGTIGCGPVRVAPARPDGANRRQSRS